MQIDMETIIDIYTEKVAMKEKENVLLQAQVIQLQKQIQELTNKIQELEEPLPELIQ